MRLCAVAVSLAALVSIDASAQWSSDPSNNLSIADMDGEQVQPKIVLAPNGYLYVSWFDNSSGGYDVRLQQLDPYGNEVWPHDGIVVATRDITSNEEYGLAADADGNALLAFDDHDGDGVMQILAQKVDPDGNLLWGDPGIFVSDEAPPDGSAHAPRISATGDGGVAVAWSGSKGEIEIRKLDGDGNAIWTPGVTIPTSILLAVGGLAGDADGNVIVSWIVLDFSAPHSMFTQKLAAADGANLWGDDPVVVEDASSSEALQLGNFPGFIADGEGGAVFVWYTVGASGLVHAQHVDASGTQLFPQNGVLASIDTSQNHFEPDGAYDRATGNIYVIWRETDLLTQNDIGVNAQRIDATGARQWGDGGVVLVPLETFVDKSQLTALFVDGFGFIGAWASGGVSGPTPLHATRLDVDGNYVWPGDVVDFSTEPNETSRLAGTVGPFGYVAYVWTAAATQGSGDVHAQNVNVDGTLGIPDDTNDRVFVNGFDP